MTAHELQAFSQEMVGLLTQLLRGVTRRETHALASGQLSLPQFLLLETLTEQPQTTMQELARRSAVTKGAVTGAVDRLVRAGYVRRRRDTADRRIVWVCLTSRGTAVLRDIKTQKRLTMQTLFRGVSSRDREIYLRIFRQICASLVRP